jgi:hypothetical protein
MMNDDELLKAVSRLPRSIEPPRDLWPEIEARLRGRRRRWYWVSLAAAAAVVGLLVARSLLGPTGVWEIAPLAGLPRVGQAPLAGVGALRVGEWVETDDSSRAVIQVGEIGHVEVRPGSRLRLVEARATDHRLALAVGEIYAQVSAPPRLFFVETPAGVAIDLGCAYTLRVDTAGNGFLHVTAGAVEFEWGGGSRRSIVPFDARIEIRQGFGPGVPVVAGASDAFRRALEVLEFEAQGEGEAALRRVLALARRDDGLSLWHLLARTEGASRAGVYERLAELVPPPAGVTREAVLRLHPDALDAYWNWLPHSVWLKGLKGRPGV